MKKLVLILTIVCHGSCFDGALTETCAAEVENRHLVVLRDHQIPPTRAGISTFLNSLDPASDHHQRRLRIVRGLIEQLGDDTFSVRENAQRALISEPFLPQDVLRNAAAASDPEVAWRAKKILKATSPSPSGRSNTLEGVTAAVCRTIVHQKMTGLTEPLLAAISSFEDRNVLRAMRTALAESAEREDAALLRDALKSESEHVRLAALEALATVLGEDARQHHIDMLADSSERVRLSAARAMGDMGDHQSLAPLVRLLSAEQLDVRVSAVQALRALAGRRFDYLAYEDSTKRSRAIEKWTAWVRDEGFSAKLNFPIKATPVEVGRTLITDYGGNRVIEVNERGDKTWEVDLKTPWGCQGLPNGHRVVSSYSGKFVVEFDAKGQEVWRKDGLPGNGMGLHRLENGNTLVACSHSNQVVEYQIDGSLAWSATIRGRPVDVQRLENGRTLVALEAAASGQRVVEVDHAGKIVWEISDIKKPLSVDRLENGNTLVSPTNDRQVVEYDRSGREVWQHTTSIKATDAARLQNGSTVVASPKFVQMLDGKGNVQWEVKGLKYCYGVDHY